jgi:aspartate kinase
MLKVVKFGGSSLANAIQFKKVHDIILSDPERTVVVVSAAGKRNSDDHKMTDMLYLIHAHLQFGFPYQDIIEIISARLKETRDELKLDYAIEEDLDKIFHGITKSISIDELVSRGEYLSAKLMASYLGYTFVDASTCIFFGYDGQVDVPRTYEAIKDAYQKHKKIVIPGFYGVLPNQKIKIMSRGGSDITGALVAAALDAKIYENWTDVSGILMADPRIVDAPKAIRRMTYAELRELSFLGASILHEESVMPIKLKHIPLQIRNTNEPDHPGTLIEEKFENEDDPEGDDRFITGIAGRTGFYVITIYKEQILANTSIVRKTLEIFDDFNVQIEHINLGLDSFMLTVSTAQIRDRLYDVIGKIQSECAPDTVDIEDNIAMIACVGRRMRYRPGISGKLFSALGKNHINIRIITQGTNEISIIVGVESKNYNEAVKVIYDSFVG